MIYSRQGTLVIIEQKAGRETEPESCVVFLRGRKKSQMQEAKNCVEAKEQ